MRVGWFKFHRQIFDNPVCTKDAEYFFVWCYILTEAKFEEERVLFKKEEITLTKGQLITTTKDIATKLNICESKVNRILKKFEIEKQIERRTSNKNTLITVLNWDYYQSSEKQNEGQVKNEWKTNDNQMENNRQTSEEQMTNERQTSGEPSYYNKEIKKERNKEDEEDKKERTEEDTPPISPSQGEAVDEPKPKPKAKKKGPTVYYPNDEQLDEAFKEFLTMRNKIKKPLATQKALTRMMNRIEKLSGGDNDLAIKILNQSTDHCWQDVYELKGDDGNGCTRRNNTADKGRDAYAEEFERMLNGG